MKKDYSRNISLLCPICGNYQFEALDEPYEDNVSDNARFKCSDCGNIITKEELLNENAEMIDIIGREISEEVVEDFQKELKKALKGIKGLKIKL